MTAHDHPDTTGDAPAEAGRGGDPAVGTPPPGRGRRWGEFLGVLKPPPDRDSRSYGQLMSELVGAALPVFAFLVLVRASSHHSRSFYAVAVVVGLAVVVLLRLLIAWWYAGRRS